LRAWCLCGELFLTAKNANKHCSRRFYIGVNIQTRKLKFAIAIQRNLFGTIFYCTRKEKK